MTRWWRRNTAALVSLAVLLPLTAGVIGGHEWADYYLYRPTLPRDADATTGTLEMADATWGPARSAELIDLSAYDVPAGVRVIAVALPVDPHGAAPTCTIPVLVEQSTGRQWDEMRAELGIPLSFEEPSACVLPAAEGDTVDPYELVLVFGVPDDAVGPFWVEVSELSEVPFVARFAIDPAPNA